MSPKFNTFAELFAAAETRPEYWREVARLAEEENRELREIVGELASREWLTHENRCILCKRWMGNINTKGHAKDCLGLRSQKWRKP